MENIFETVSNLVNNVRKSLFSCELKISRGGNQLTIQASPAITGSSRLDFDSFGLFENSVVFSVLRSDLSGTIFQTPEINDQFIWTQNNQRRTFKVAIAGTGRHWWLHEADPSGQTICIHTREVLT